jgi:hypothetical protein
LEINEKIGFLKQFTAPHSLRDLRKALTEHLKLGIVGHMPTMFGICPIFTFAPPTQSKETSCQAFELSHPQATLINQLPHHFLRGINFRYAGRKLENSRTSGLRGCARLRAADFFPRLAR